MCASQVTAYWTVRNELSVIDEVVFYGARLVVPVALRYEVIHPLHNTHQEVTKTFQRAASSIVRPGLKRRTEDQCLACELVGRKKLMRGRTIVINACT